MRTARTSRSNTTTTANSIFAVGPVKGRRRLQGPEIYSKIHYADRIQPVVAERLKTLASTGLVLNPAERLDVVKSIMRDLFEDETEEVKAEVTARMAAAQTVPIDDDQEGRTRTPQDYQK